MTRLDSAKEIFRLQALSRMLLVESAESLKLALLDPGDKDLVKEAERKLIETQMVQAELKKKLSEWN